jgi:hypothetical protein
MGRTHVVLDDDVIEAIDQVAGERGRSRFLEDAAREKLARLDLDRALRDSAGIVDPDDHPEWADEESATAWVRTIRAGSA